MTLLRDMIGVVGLLVPVLTAALLWWLSQRFAPKRLLEQIETELDEAASRLTAVEQRLNALPTAGEFSALRQTLARVEAMTEANEDLLRTIHKHLLTTDR